MSFAISPMTLRSSTWAHAGSLRGLLGGCGLLLAACGAVQPQLAADPDALAPPAAAKPWTPQEATRIPGGTATLNALSARHAPGAPAIQPKRVYDLSHLIDLALQTNPETSASWQATRAAAARLGVTEGAYLPTLSAIGMASYGYLPSYDRNGPFVARTGVFSSLLQLDWLFARLRPTQRRCR
jgi:outer membrane protein TolC